MGSVRILGIEHRPPPDGRRQRMAVALLVLLSGVGIAILSLSNGSSTTIETAPQLQPGPITSFEDVAGTYFRRGVGEQMYFRFFEDGTVHVSSNSGMVADRPMLILAATFEGTRMLIVHSRQRYGCPPPDNGGSYEIHVMPSGSLQFVALESDSCPNRSGILLGMRFGFTTAHFEWVQVDPESGL